VRSGRCWPMLSQSDASYTLCLDSSVCLMSLYPNASCVLIDCSLCCLDWGAGNICPLWLQVLVEHLLACYVWCQCLERCRLLHWSIWPKVRSGFLWSEAKCHWRVYQRFERELEKLRKELAEANSALQSARTSPTLYPSDTDLSTPPSPILNGKSLYEKDNIEPLDNPSGVGAVEVEMKKDM
jgi:hypothetical protein